MDLKILMIILSYWTIFLIIFGTGGASVLLDDGYTVSSPLNETEIGTEEIDEGGFFGTGVSFGRFVGFALFGIGVGASMPSWASFMIAGWQTLFTIFTIGFVLSSIWDG